MPCPNRVEAVSRRSKGVPSTIDIEHVADALAERLSWSHTPPVTHSLGAATVPRTVPVACRARLIRLRPHLTSFG